MKLYYSAVSPYVRKVMIVAIESGLRDAIEPVPVSLSPYKPNADVVAFNPLGKIPVLVTDDGLTLHDSNVIVEYLLSKKPESAIVPKEGIARFAALTRASLADGIIVAAQLLRFEKARPADLVFSDWADAQEQKIERSLAHFDGEPPASFDLCAITLYAALDWIDLRFPDLSWRNRYGSLSSWFASMTEQPSIVATRMPTV